MFHTRWYRWTGVALGVLLGGGVAVAAPESGGDTSAQEDQSSSGDTDGCKEAGVTVTFSVGSTSINMRGRTSLNAVAKWMKAESGRTVRVDGYTDKTGNPERNKILSDRRADAVKKYLTEKGIDADSISTEGHGDVATHRPDLKNTRAVAVTACASPKTAAAPPPEEKPAEPAPVAETVPEVPPPPPPPTVIETPPPPPIVINNNMPAPAPHPDMPGSGIGVGVTLGGGAVGFWEDGTKAFVDIGGSWDVRATIGTRLPVAFEVAYVGTAQGMNSLGLSNDAILLGSTAEGDVRINFTRSRLQPYIFGGAGYTYYRVTNTAISTSDLQRTDNVFEIPFGAGLSWRVGQAFLLDIRGTGRWTFDDELFKVAATTTNAGNSHLYNWMGTAHLGWEF